MYHRLYVLYQGVMWQIVYGGLKKKYVHDKPVKITLEIGTVGCA
jgi:hypothetical protein